MNYLLRTLRWFAVYLLFGCIFLKVPILRAFPPPFCTPPSPLFSPTALFKESNNGRDAYRSSNAMLPVRLHPPPSLCGFMSLLLLLLLVSLPCHSLAAVANGIAGERTTQTVPSLLASVGQGVDWADQPTPRNPLAAAALHTRCCLCAAVHANVNNTTANAIIASSSDDRTHIPALVFRRRSVSPTADCSDPAQIPYFLLSSDLSDTSHFGFLVSSAKLLSFIRSSTHISPAQNRSC